MICNHIHIKEENAILSSYIVFSVVGLFQIEFTAIKPPF